MKKKVLRLLLVIVCLLSGTSVSAYDFEVDGIYYNYDAFTKTATVTYRSSSYGGYEGVVNIPETVTYNGTAYPVVSIGAYAFRTCVNMTEVNIPNSVTSINDGAFYECFGLSGTLVIPNNTISIGAEAFKGCHGLTGVLTIPSSVTSIGANAFYGCYGLTELVISDGTSTLTFLTTSAAPYPFNGCRIERIYLGRDISCDSNYSPFGGCSYFESLTIGVNVTTIGTNDFNGCSKLVELTISDSADALNFPTSSFSPFRNCSISDLYLGRNLNYTGNAPFDGCSVKTLTIGNKVTSIGSKAFYSCHNLTDVILLDGKDTLEFINQASAYRTFTLCPIERIYLGRNISTSRFYDYTYPPFEDKSTLKTLVIGDSVTFIMSGAFKNCSGLTELTIPDNVTSINASAFRGCSRLTDLSISRNAKSLGEYAFAECSNLAELIIPSSVTSIGKHAFRNCPSLASIYSLNPTPPGINPYTFDESTTQQATLYVPIGSKTAYQQDSYWKNFFDIQEGVSADLEAINVDRKGKNEIYNVNGMKVASTSLSNLPNGVYIVNGKKVVVK